MDTTLFDTAERLFASICTPAALRKIEAGGEVVPMWDSLEESGFGFALLPESSNGAGLTLQEVWPVMLSAGRHAVPVPMVNTMLARAWIAQQRQPIEHGSVTFAPFGAGPEGDQFVARNVSFGQVASWILAVHDNVVRLLPADEAIVHSSGGHGSLDADLVWKRAVADRAVVIGASPAGIAELHALAQSALIAGAADRVLAMTLDYANQRSQFGKPIGKFQALQQQISEMAELVFAARMASEMACRGDVSQLNPHLAQLAKSRASQGVSRIVAIAHAVHGAIGVTHEYDLQLFTRRLNEWARAGGGAGFWSRELGRAFIGSGMSAVDFARTTFFGENQV